MPFPCVKNLKGFISSQFSLIKNNTPFIKDIGTLISGQALSQAISFVLVPIVARLYTPADYGVLALFIAFLSMFYQWSSLTYNQAIVLASDDKEAVQVMTLSILCLLGVCALALMGSFFTARFLRHFQWVQTLSVWIYIVPLGILIHGLSEISQSWNTRKKQFKTIALAQASSVAATGGTRIFGGMLYGSNVAWLNIGLLAGFFINGVIQFKNFGRKYFFQLFSVKRTDLVRLAKKYRDFPIYNVPANLINSIFQGLPIFMLGFLFNPMIVGYYALTRRLLGMPVQMLSQSTKRVLLQKLSELKNENKSLKGPFVKTTLGLLFISIVPALIIFFAGEYLFSILLGKSWATSGSYAALLLPWFITRMVIQPSNVVYIVLMQQRVLFWFQLLGLVSQLLMFTMSYVYKLTPENTLIGFMAVATAFNCCIIFFAYFKISKAS